MSEYADHWNFVTEEGEEHTTYFKDRDVINPNLLRATNSCTEIETAQWADASWGGGGTGDYAGVANALGKTSITVDDAPDLDLNIGWELNNSENPVYNSGLQQRDIPIEPNTPCTMSCYIRGHGYFRMYLTLTNYGTYEDYIDTDEWEYHSFVSQIPDENTGRAFYTVLGSNEGGSEGTIDICGMKLEEGETATRWCPSYWDMEDKNLTEQKLDLDKEETTVESFTDFIANFVSGTRIGQWFKDFWAGCKYILHVGSLVNNCVSENTDLPLAATQGKVLMDEITQLKSDIVGDFFVTTLISDDVTASSTENVTWRLTGTNEGYTPIMYSLAYTYGPYLNLSAETATMSSGTINLTGAVRVNTATTGSTSIDFNMSAYVLWRRTQ